MSVILRPLRSFYHEFGLSSVHETGFNAHLIIIARSCRMFAYGTNALVLAIFFSALNFSDHMIGIFMTLTLLGDVFLGTFLTLIADRVGRRRVLLGGSVLMMLSGAAFAMFENFWILLIAAIFGVISVTGGDFGPFRSIEESILSQLTTSSKRSDVLAWYVTTSTLGSSLGSEASGRILAHLQARDSWSDVDAYHVMFWIYGAMGVVNLILVLALTDECELSSAVADDTYVQVNQHEIGDPDGVETSQRPQQSPSASAPQTWTAKFISHLPISVSQISSGTLHTMYKLWFLLAIDCLADGMVPYTLTNYYLDLKFQPSPSTLGDVTSVAYFLGAICAVFAGPLAHRIGLINTMVFTHVPSSAAVLFFPLPPYFWMTAALLLLRAGLNNMDQAPRTAFIAAVVKPEERTAVMGITTMIRTLVAMSGPTVTGVLAASDRFWIAFVVAGVCRLGYDFGLYAMFVNMKIDEGDQNTKQIGTQRGQSEEEDIEIHSLASSDEDSERDSLENAHERLKTTNK